MQFLSASSMISNIEHTVSTNGSKLYCINDAVPLFGLKGFKKLKASISFTNTLLTINIQ